MAYIQSCPIAPGRGHEAGRMLLQALYSRHQGGPMPEVLVAQGGKPYFAGGGWHFSISHTKTRAFCALSRVPVGLDAEDLDRQVPPALAEKVLSPGELEQYRRAPDPNRALLTFWVLKEAAAKLSGRGLRIWPNDTDFSLEDPRVQILDGCLVAVMEENNDAL
jgi:phosphopantetheinyl transferase